MTKVKIRFKQGRPDLMPDLENVRVDGVLKGCHGFVTDPAPGRHVCIDAETVLNPHTDYKVLYRTASHTNDYSGGPNRYCDFDRSVCNDLVHCVTELLKEGSS